MSNFMNSGLSAGMGGPMSLEEYQDFLRGQSQGAMGSAQRAMESLALPPRSSGFLAGRLGDVFTSEEPPAPAPMPDNVAAMSGVPTGATDTSSMTREEIAALPQMRDISNKMMANTTVPSMNNPMGFSPNLGVVGRGIMGGKGGVS
tara:strand:- start:2232 stop:2669 length:438 start_codon:yes stop_codon:yes gene_type:complete